MDEEILPNKKIETSELKDAITEELASYINPALKTPIVKVMPQAPQIPQTQTDTGEIFNQGTYQNAGNVQPEIRKPVIRTYKSDVEETVQAGHISSVNIALSENKRMMRNISYAPVEEEKKKINWGILSLIIVLVVGGGLAIFIPYFLVQKQNAPKTAPVQTVPAKSIVSVDSEEKINLKDLNQNRIAKTLDERVEQSAITIGTIKNIYLTEGEGQDEKLLTAQKFLSLINANVPDDIARTLRPEYMFGMYSYGGNQKFLLLKVGEYDLAYSGMFSWESDLWQDFKPLFGLNDNSTSTVSSGPTSQFAIEIKKFQDATFFNKDCRIVKDANGQIIFLYSIINENTILLTTSIDTLKEILNRINNKVNVTQ